MIRVGVRNNDRMDSAQWDTSCLHPAQQSVPACFPRKSRVHEGKAALILECIGIDVPEPCEVDRELKSENAGRNFGYIW
jgi:hypothetical protein